MGTGRAEPRLEQGLEWVLSGGVFPPPQWLVPVLRRQEVVASFLQQVFIFW